MLSRRHTLALSAILCTGAVAGGSVINVPEDHPNIRDAIDAAVNGDTVVVAPGTYTGVANRNLDFAGKAITVRSTDPDDAEIVASTVIDCGQAGRAFLFQSGETPASVVDGLTITKGFATEGAGVFLVNGSGATIRNCVFIQNTTPDFNGVIQVGNNPVEPAELRILDCTIQDTERERVRPVQPSDGGCHRGGGGRGAGNGASSGQPGSRRLRHPRAR